MGSNAGELPSRDDEITVVVTGFGPFRPQNPLNPSWEIARLLPPFLPPGTADEASTFAEQSPVRILVYPEPIRVAYKTVTPLVPKLWDGKKVDYMIHIGMASGRKFYSVERRGHRDGYTMRDVDDELLADTDMWKDMPEVLLTDTNIDDIWQRWMTALPDIDLRLSEDAGRYLCDFIYFSSLAHLARKKEEMRVVFLHVPVDANEVALKTGVDVTIELIRAMVKSGQMKKLAAGS